MDNRSQSPAPVDSMALARRLIATLPTETATGLFNPWRDTCQDDSHLNTPSAKMRRLAAHLDCLPKLILCGEAPGHFGCRHSGIAFTSESLLMDGAIPRIPRLDHRLTTFPRPLKEQSATIVWKALYRLGVAEETIMWNAVQLHPHAPGNHRSNRTPSDVELAHGAAGLRVLVDSFPTAFVVAVGRKAEVVLTSLGMSPAVTVRHPANGGSHEFNEGIEAFISSLR